MKQVRVETQQSGAFQLAAYSTSGERISCAFIPNTTPGWITIDTEHDMDPPLPKGITPYELRFVNAAPHDEHKVSVVYGVWRVTNIYIILILMYKLKI